MCMHVCTVYVKPIVASCSGILLRIISVVVMIIDIIAVKSAHKSYNVCKESIVQGAHMVMLPRYITSCVTTLQQEFCLTSFCNLILRILTTRYTGDVWIQNLLAFSILHCNIHKIKIIPQ